MGTRIEIISKSSISNNTLDESVPIRIYNINHDFTKKEIDEVVQILSDPVTEIYSVNQSIIKKLGLTEKPLILEVSPKPGVTDSEGETAKKTIEKAIKKPIDGISYSKIYNIKELNSSLENKVKSIANPLIFNSKLFWSNDIEKYDILKYDFPEVKLLVVSPFSYILTPEGHTIKSITSDADLMKISNSSMVELDITEMKTIRNLLNDENYITIRNNNGLKDKFTDAEIKLIGQSWSEHCKHKKFNAVWTYESKEMYDDSNISRTTDSVFDSIIKKNTLKIIKKYNWVVSVFKDNAGVIKLNDEWNIAHKVETHNHPSSLDPFGGANTGSGGVFRDPFHTGKGMIVVSSQYAFRVSHPKDFDDLPNEILDGGIILDGIVKGVEDYGNKMGIPTMLGNVMMNKGWLKPAVYVGAVAVQKSIINGRPTHEKEVKNGYVGITIGGRVGKDGIHGATASSTGLSADAEKNSQVNQSVQIGNPIVERNYFEAVKKMVELDIIEASQDCGAGGWNSAVSELAELSNGALLDLSKVYTKYPGLTGWEKLVSESQERGIIVVKPENIDRVMQIANHYNVEALTIAEFNNSGYYKVKDQDQTIAFIPMDFLTQGLPKMEIKAEWKKPLHKEPKISTDLNLEEIALKLISSSNMQSYDWISTRYDHEVRGGSIIKPLIGKGKARSDAIAYWPVLGQKEVVIESWGSNPWQGMIDPYHMGVNNVVDAIGRVIAAGGGLPDNHEYKMATNGNTTCAKPEKDSAVAASVIRMLKGAADAELYFKVPRISGKDSTSMQREYRSAKTGQIKEVKALSELLISIIGVIPDSSTLVTPDFKEPGDLIYLIGETDIEIGASEFLLNQGYIGNNVPLSYLINVKKRFEIIQQANEEKNLLKSSYYLGKGGLFFGLANSSIANSLGVNIDIYNVRYAEKNHEKLFSETPGRFLISISKENKDDFERMMKNKSIITRYTQIGTVSNGDYMVINNNTKPIMKIKNSELGEAFHSGIRY